MRNLKGSVSIRADVRSYDYLRARGHAESKSITDTLAEIIDGAERAEPVEFEITRCLYDGGTTFSAHLGFAHSIYEGPSLEEAKRAIEQFRLKEGFDARRFRLKRAVVDEDFRGPPLTAAEDNN